MKHETQRSPMVPNTTKLDPKKQQFLKDLQELLDHYQYRLVPVLQNSVKGITPAVAFPNALPASNDPAAKMIKKASKKGKKK